MNVLNMLVSAGLLFVICYVVVVIAKVIVVFRITSSKSRKISDESVSAITKMMSYDPKFNFKK